MHVVIKDVAQALSLETGQTYSYLTLMLPNGKEFRAAVADDTIAEVTQLFVQSGSPAAQVAAERASVEPQEPSPVPAPVRREPAPMQRSYAPMEITEDGDGEPISTFGGNYNPDADPELEAVGSALQQASDQLAHAIGDTSTLGPAELRQVVDRIANTPPVMPVPSLMKEAPVRQLTKPHVEADAMGNPILKGNGLVDPRGLMGGNTEGEEDAGQV